uniref:serine O-acetyltransferase n=1 Tax=Araucaria cunninghamii TaxID=56994 RepID=A0A0D6R2Z2_ARACU
MDLSLTHSAAINSSYQHQYKRWSSRDTLIVICNVNKNIGRGKFSGFSESRRKILKVAAENSLWRPQMEGIDQNSRGARTIAYCNGNGRDEDKSNGHIHSNSSEDREKFGQEKWENMFPAYMQSKAEELEEEEVAVEAENGNGCQGLDLARAAAAAAASAKELQSRVKSSRASQVVPPSLWAPPCSTAKPPTEGGKHITELMSADPIWAAMRVEARLEAEKEPLLSSYLYASILAHSCFERALGFVLANRLQNPILLATQLMDVFDEVFLNDASIQQSIRLDVQAVKDRDPSCRAYSWALLYLKGYHALQSYRIAHALWNRGQRVLALALQSRISEVFAVDIHPAARIGKGILLDHGTGVVIGETAVVGDRVSMLQGVTLGGTGKEVGDRHPKIGGGVLIGAGATILGNITVGKGAMVAAGSLVLKDIPPHSMAAGTPAKVIGFLDDQNPALTMKHDATKGFCQLVAEDSLHSGAGI